MTAANDSGPDGREPREPGRIDEAAILRDGEQAARKLGARLARVASADPASIDPKRFRRLGRDGMASFLAELRSELPKPRKPSATRSSRFPPDKPAPPAGLGKVAPKRMTKTAPLDGVEGWWKRSPEPPFEQTARRRGYILGAFLILCLVYLLLWTGL